MKKRLTLGRTTISMAVLLLALGALLPAAEAQPYPSRPIDVIVPWNAGSATDLVPRALVPRISRDFGVPINVVNKPGASGISGTLEALKARPDGYTLHADGIPVSVHIGAWKDLPYDPANRTFIARAVVLPWMIAVKADSPWKSLGDIEQTLRQNPSSFRWSWLGGGGGVDVVIVQLKAEYAKRGVDLAQTKTVTYTGGGLVIPALAGGHVDIAIGSDAVLKPMLSAGKIRIIAACGTERFKPYPHVPTTAEQGFPGVTLASYWVGYFGPPALPEAIVGKWQRSIKAALDDPEMSEKVKHMGGRPAYLGGEDFKKFILKEAEEVRAVMKQQ